MIRYKLYFPGHHEVIVSLNANSGHQYGKITVDGPAKYADAVERWLRVQTGLTGRLISSRATPFDLAIAMLEKPARKHKATLIEGKHLLKGALPPLPDGAVH